MVFLLFGQVCFSFQECDTFSFSTTMPYRVEIVLWSCCFPSPSFLVVDHHIDVMQLCFLTWNVFSSFVIGFLLTDLEMFLFVETEQGVAQAIIRSVVDFKRDPWPRVSDNAKDLVKKMLDPDPKRRLTAQEVLGNVLICQCDALLMRLRFVS